VHANAGGVIAADGGDNVGLVPGGGGEGVVGGIVVVVVVIMIMIMITIIIMIIIPIALLIARVD